MDEAARALGIGPAKAVNPRTSTVIKYPNWFDHFRNLGFNLETEPGYFDKLYTGGETRDAVFSNQRPPPCPGDSIFRYFDNLKPGANAGGGVDTGGRRHLERYAEQLRLTLFAKAPDSQVTRVAGYVFEQVDDFLGPLGKPAGCKNYKPFHSSGQGHLASYLGMAGIATGIVPAGHNVVITSGRAGSGILLPEIRFATNDGWEVLNAILRRPRPLRTPGRPAHLSLFLYDNNPFIVEAFGDSSAQAGLVLDRRCAKVRDLAAGAQIPLPTRLGQPVLETFLRPGSCRVLAAE